MTSEVVYKSDLRTTCTHLKSSSHFDTDAPTDNNGKGERFSPTDLLATSLAACMATVMGIKARSIGFDLDDMRVTVLKKMEAAPRRVSGIDLKFHIPETLQHIEPKTIVLLKNAGITCPVAKSLHPDIKVSIDWGAWS